MNFSSENADLRFDRPYKDSMTAFKHPTATIKVRAPMNGSEPLPHSHTHLEVKQVLVSLPLAV